MLFFDNPIVKKGIADSPDGKLCQVLAIFPITKIARFWEDESQNINMIAIPFLTVFHYMILLCQVPAIFCNRKNCQNMTVHNWESKCSGIAYLVIGSLIGSPDFWEMNPRTFGLPITKVESTLCLKPN
jgi:hypothetical protein